MHVVPLVLTTRSTIPKTTYDSLQLPSRRPGLYILMQKAVILNTSCTAGKFVAEN